jgi:hypothetical protein
MSRVKRFEQYPIAFWNVLESIIAGSPVEVRSATTKPLVALRTSLYYYSKAIREMPLEHLAAALEKLQEVDREVAQRMAIKGYGAACDMFVTLRGDGEGGHILRISSRKRDSPLSRLLSDSLRLPAAASQMDEAAQRSAERLLEILKGK